MGNCNFVFTAFRRSLLLWNQRFIGAVNGALVVGIIASFTVLVVVASGDLHWDALLKANVEAAPRSIPIIALSFVYQNVVPVLCTNLEGNLSKTAIVLGTAIPLLLFLVWDGVILGTITTSEMDPNTLVDPLQQLRSTNGVVGPIVDVFSVLAISTSYIGFVLGLSDFLADCKSIYICITISDAVLKHIDICSAEAPGSLSCQSGFTVLVMFGVLPAAMSWSDRYSESSESPKIPLLVPGGKFTLSLVIGGAGLVILTEIIESFGHA
ncbi:hypothetical protein CASFOL_034115 [Castilleja foliolosa]|uniref:Uncharacterized protein n=1 Tax=Castilleja foliolosa TaxID=1961234 RepID=A0ABD3BXH5_9LAMI